MYAPNHYPSGRRNYCCDVKGIASAVSTLRSRQTLHRVRRSVSRKCFFFFSVRVDHSAPISPSIVAALVQTDGRLLFATRFNHRLDVNMSPIPDPAAWRVDSLSFSLSNLYELCLPPPLSLLPKVFRKAGLDQATMILVASRWPDRPWFPGLLALMHVPPLKLHIGPKTLSQSRSGFPDGNPHVLDLHASLLRRACCLHTRRVSANASLSQEFPLARYPVHLCSAAYMVWKGI